jgi:Ca2+-binding EF-hand superfamily protein
MADIEKARAVFANFDLDKDGRITAAELTQVLADLGGSFTDEQSQQLLGLQDADGDGTLSFDEFWAAYERNNG